MRFKVSRLLLAIGLVTTVTLAGCSTSKKDGGMLQEMGDVPPSEEDYYDPFMDSPPTTGMEEKPKPKPKPVVKCDDCPTHFSDAEWSWSSMAYPTGNPSTSAVCVEKGMPHEV